MRAARLLLSPRRPDARRCTRAACRAGGAGLSRLMPLGPVEVEDRRALGAEDRALVLGRHVAARPVLGAADRPAARVEHDDEAGQVLVHAAQAVVDPRAEARAAGEDLARVHLQHRRAVDRRVGGHRVQEGDVIDARGQVREQVADPLAALAVLLELPLRPDDPALVLLAAAAEGLHLHGLAVQAVQLRLVVERIDVAGPAVHEQEDHALRLGGEVRLLRRQRIGERAAPSAADACARRSRRRAGRPGPGR